mgnify:CR=1 FL=1
MQKISDLHSIISEIFSQIPSSIIHKYMLTSISDNNSHFNNQFLSYGSAPVKYIRELLHERN